MIIKNINFTADFFVQPDQLHYKKTDCRKYWGALPPNSTTGGTHASAVPRFLHL